MDWSASLDTSSLVSSAEEANKALGAMKGLLGEVGDALKGLDGKDLPVAVPRAVPRGKVGGGGEPAPKAGPVPAAVPKDDPKAIAARVKSAQDAAYLKTRQDAARLGWSGKQEAAQLAERRRVISAASGASVLEVTKLAEKEASAKEALRKDNLAKVSSVDSGALKALGAAGLLVGAGLAVATGAMSQFLSLAERATGVASFGDLTQLAIGARAMSQIQGIQGRTNLGFRMMFRGIDSSPLVRATDLFSRNFTAQTATGRVLGETLSRAYGGAFRLIERLEPAATGAFQGMLLGALMIEGAWLRLRIAAFPITSAIQRAIGPTDALGVAGAAVALVFAQVADAVDTAAAAAGGLARAAKAIGLIDDAPAKAKKGAVPGAVAGGAAVGGAMGAGMVAGLDGQQGALYDAGKRAAEAALKGSKAAAEIRSPAHRFRREVGRQIGAGVVGGIDDSAPQIERAAAKSLVPDPAALSFGGGGRGAGVTVSGPLVSVGQIVVQGAGDLAAEVRRIIDTEVSKACETLGIRVLGGA